MEGLDWIVQLKDEITEPIRKIRTQLGDMSEDLSDIKSTNAMTWADMAIGLNQSLELVNKLSDALDFTSEYASLRTATQQFTDLTGDALDEVTAKAFNLQQVYGDDGKEIIKAANALTKQNGGTLEENLAIIEAGYQKGGNLNNDMLHQLSEYGTQMAAVGLSNAETMAVIAHSNKMGIYDDKALDAIKEAGLSLREMGKTQIEALKGIGIKPEDIEGLTTFDAMKYITGKMQGANSQAQQLIMADIFKGAGEDAGAGFLEGLSSIDLNINNIESIQTAGDDMKGFFADVKATIANTVGNVGPWVNGLSQLSTALLPVIMLTKGLTIAQIKANIAMLANPVGLVVAGIIALIAVVTTVIVKYDEWGAALSIVLGPLGMVINLIQSFRRNWEDIKKVFSEEGILEGIKKIGLVIFDSLLMPIQQLMEIASNIPGVGGWAKSAAESISQYRKDLGLNTGEEKKQEKSTDARVESNTSKARVLDFSGVADIEGGSSGVKTSKGSSGVGFASAEKKTINVRIDKLIENFTITTTNISESTADLKNKISRAIIDGVRDAEVAI